MIDNWTTSGPQEVAPQVHRIPLPMPNDGLRAVNVYAIEDSSGLVLIDSGWAIAEARDALKCALAELGHTFDDITRVLMTHVHRDHYSQGVELRREFGTRLCLGAGERPSIEAYMDVTEAPLAPQLAALRRHGAEELAAELERRRSARTLTWEPPDDWLFPGPIALGDRVLTAVETPGHTRGHLVFADEQAGLLFAGDHVLPEITPSIGFEPAPAAQPLRAYLGSLRTVKAMPDMTLLPAHGPALGSSHARIDELLDHHRDRLAAAAALVDGPTCARAVAERLTWTRHERRLSDFDPFNRMLAVLETAAHLDLLVAQGVLQLNVVDGIVRYDSLTNKCL